MCNKFYLLLFSLKFFAICSQAQTITQRTISSSGQYLSNQGLNLNFTVGELVIENLKDSTVGVNTGLFGKQTLVFREQPVVAGTASLSVSSFCTSGSATIRSTGYTLGRQYQWQYSTDSFITDVHDLPGQTNPDSSITGLVTATTYYRLKVCCASASTPVYSTIVTLTIKQPPAIPVITLSGDAAFCAGDKVTLTSSASSGNQWYRDDSAIAGANGQTYDATQSGSYTVKNNSNGCLSNASTAVIVTVQTVPPTPTISQSATKLISSAPSGNQWYLNGKPIAGATDTVYIPIVSGDYSVQATINDCSSQRSADFAFVITAINDPVLESQIQVYPNPFNSKIIITNRSTETLSVQFYGVLGRLLLSRKVLVGSYEIQTTAFAKGLYIIRIRGERTNKSITKLIEKN